ncbi:hypothetical protein HJG60_012092 [Phyllostomus discolor]|uniref:Secreted protein n=1 Tax=Phyllostomus discolor TaxID=89673 RepID=A0A834DWD5_9CHIR|nr:hypothetical protein HJG60_012092 [Phyllostomus discolor]
MHWFSFLSRWTLLLCIPSHSNRLCSKFEWESSLEIHLGRQEAASEYCFWWWWGYRVFKALIILWTPSLLPQTMLLLHFLKMQFTPRGWRPHARCSARPWEDKEERCSPRASVGPQGRRCTNSVASSLALENGGWPHPAQACFKLP